MIPTRTLGKPFFLNLPRCFYHEASRLHFLQLLANTVAGRWGTSLDVLWSETLMWWNSNLEHYDVEGGISRNEWNRSESLYEQIYPASYFLWSHRLSGFNLNLFAYRISAPFIYLIRWYRDTFYQSGLPIPSIKRPASTCRDKRAAGRAPNCAGFPRRKWTTRSLPVGPGRVMPLVTSIFHEASDILGYVGFPDLDLFEILDLVLLTFAVWVPRTAKRY